MANAASALNGTASQAALKTRREIFWLGWVPLAVEAVKSEGSTQSMGVTICAPPVSDLAVVMRALVARARAIVDKYSDKVVQGPG